MAKKKDKAAPFQYSEDKQARRDEVIAQLEKAHGTGIVSLGQQIVDIDIIPTGALGLDIALGVGGIPRGRITEIFGPESSGKTTLALTIAYNAQKEGGIVAFIDAEHALDPVYATKIGVDLDKLMITQPDNGEQALNVVETLCESGAVDLIVIDSVAALVPKAELDGEVGDSHIGAQSRMMSQCLRKLVGKAKRSNTAVVFINQLREKIGVMFGSPETTPGGRALKFYSSVRLDIRKIGQNKVNDVASGNKTKVKVIKNKVAPPFKECEFEIVYGKGIENKSCILSLAVEYGLIDKKGSHYSMGEIKLGNGDAQATAFLNANEPMADELEVEILQRSKKGLIVKPQNGATTAPAKAAVQTILEEDDDGFDEAIE